MGRRLTVHRRIQQRKIIILIQYTRQHREQSQTKNRHKQRPLPRIDLHAYKHGEWDSEDEQVRGDVEARLHDAVIVIV